MKEKLEDLLYWLAHTKNSIWHPLRWAWQRLTRGWDDRVIWSIYSYLARMMPVWLQELKVRQHGIPASMFDDLNDDSDASMEAATKKWDGILDGMIAGFEAARQINNMELPIYEEFYQLVRDKPGGELKIAPEERLLLKIDMDFWARRQAQEDEAMERFRKGMALFAEHYFSLWD